MTGRIAIVLLAVSCIVLAWNVRSDPYDDYDRTLYPDAAADFLLRTGMQGRIFNYYNWGGYLIWRLYPQFRIFVDNRGISDEAYTIHQSILAAGDGWDARLDSLGMNIIVLSPLDILAGQIFPLIPALVHSPSWRLVYYDDKSVLFLRNGPLNAPVIGIYSMPKERAYLTVQAMAAAGIARSPGDADFFLSMGEALNALGQNEEAERYYRHADGLLSSGAGQ